MTETPETAPETPQEQTPETAPETPPEPKTKAKQNKGNRIMTPERIQNLQIARAKASLLRKQLREANVIEKPPTKLEVKLEKIKLNKTKNEAPDIPVDIPMVSKMEEPKYEETSAKVEESPTPPTAVERVVKQEEPPPVIKKPLYRREGQFLFM
jgi:hypothetical protein